MKKGMTLVETVVAMAIFITVLSLAIAAFVTVSRMKTLTANMRESQQKVRVALEMISRMARQAEKVTVSSDGKSVELAFNFKDTYSGNEAVNKFTIVDTGSGVGTIRNYECAAAEIEYQTKSCRAWDTTTSKDLFGESFKINFLDTSFAKDGTVPPELIIDIDGFIPRPGDTSEDFDLLTNVVLENIK